MRLTPHNAGAAGAVFIIVYFGVILLMLGGWVANLVKLVGSVLANEPIGTMVVARAVGLFAFPLGSILGWF